MIGRAPAALALLAAALLAACGGGAPAAPAPAIEASPAAEASPTAPTTEATAPPEASAPPAPPRYEEPDAVRAFADLRTLAVDIGARPAGSEAERRAASFLAERLEEAGYDVTIEEFEVVFPGFGASVSAADVADAGGWPARAIPMVGSPDGEATGPLVAVGLGDAAGFEGADAAGAVALADRGVITFAEKARRALAAGAVALVVVNDGDGPLAGDLEAASGIAIPVVGVAGEDGEALRALARGRAPVTVFADSGRRAAVSRNVVARTGGAPCRGYLGAHYDTVPNSPGANDNASGAALLIELARTHWAEGVCYAAFGAEEIGLHGSRRLVREHGVEGVEWMLNFDMVARIGAPGPSFILGDEALARRASAVAAALGRDVPPGRYPPHAASDHASFEERGVPAITVFSGGHELIHTPLDAIGAVSSEDLAVMLEVSAALLRDLIGDLTGTAAGG